MNLFIKMADGFTACIKADAWTVEDIHVIAWNGETPVAIINKANIDIRLRLRKGDSEMNELLDIKCPLCGNPVEITSEESYNRQHQDFKHTSVGIRCWECGLHMYDNETTRNYNEKKEYLIRNWTRLKGE